MRALGKLSKDDLMRWHRISPRGLGRAGLARGMGRHRLERGAGYIFERNAATFGTALIPFA